LNRGIKKTRCKVIDMKRIIILFYAVFAVAYSSFAQSPMGIKYQGVARDAFNQPIESQQIAVRFSILENSPTGSSVYVETQSPTTSDLGIFSVNIGMGTLQSGNFSDINWKENQYWMQVEMDVNGGSDFLVMGTSQILAVPYAFHAETVTHNDDADPDPLNEFQTLSFNDSTNQLSISNGNTVNLNTNLQPQSSNNIARVFYISKEGNNSTAEIGQPQLAWADPQVAITQMKDGDIMYFLSGQDTFYLDDGIYLDSLQNIQIIGNYATLMRAPQSETVTTLAASYTGGLSITVDSIPPSWKIGDYIHLVVDTTYSGLSSRVYITGISGTTITINDLFLSGPDVLFTAEAGARVLENFTMFWGRFSATEANIQEGVNKNIKVENVIFDGNKANNTTNYSWFLNSAVGLNGQGSQINGCIFKNHTAEVVIGGGMHITNCRFEENGGSAFHSSTHDKTFADNGSFTFTNNIVKNCNLIENSINGHNEGNISLSWNGGECTISDNYFVDTKKTSILGTLTGFNGQENDRENIIFVGNRAVGYEQIIILDGSSHGLIISNNIFDNCGILNTQVSFLDSVSSIKICSNLALNGTVIATGFKHKCDSDLALGNTATLNDAYDNFGSSASTITVDGAQGQGDLVFNAASNSSIRFDMGSEGAFEVRRYSEPDRYNIKTKLGDVFFKTPFGNNYIQFVNDADYNILKLIPGSNHLKIGSVGNDYQIGMGLSNPNGIFQNGYLGFLFDFSFDDIGTVSEFEYNTRLQFGNLNDGGTAAYSLIDYKANLNKSFNSRRYNLINTDNITINLTGTGVDTLTGFRWNPTVFSTGGGFENRALDIYSGKTIFHPGTAVSIEGELTVPNSVNLGNVKIITGTGSPEGIVAAAVGSFYLRSDGGPNTTLYIKESGTDETGWVPK
jgi:hypothetical protein